MDIKKILVPVDGSPGSAKAVYYAIDFARALNASVVFLHVVTPMAPALSADFIRSTLKECDALAKKVGVASEDSIRKGTPWEEIVEEAKQDYDLIVMGSKGRTGIAHLVLGSVAENVVQHSTIPVTVVR
ncbi:Universal stress protein [uncultured archaeon]|nr:Universal stress protein [uncultured archaeon]